jgi:hypothetical protein
MANKRYDEFGAGTYDTAKIFLQADATTGALEKINLPAIPAGTSRIIDVQNTPAGNVAPGPTNIFSWTLPANTLNNNGDMLIIRCWISQAANGVSKTYTFFYSTAGNFSKAFTNAVELYFEIRLIRTAATTLNWSYSINAANSSVQIDSAIAAGTDFTTSQTIKWQITSASNNNATAQAQSVELITV